jgi:hypothetical protein
MKKYIPVYLRESSSFSSILDAEGPELDAIGSSLTDSLNQFFVELATDTGLDYWEEFAGLSSYADKSTEQRRSRIISKLRGAGTVTIDLIQSVAEAYVYGSVTVTEYPESYSFTIKFVDTRGIPSNLEDVQAAIEEIKPAHLAVSYEFTYTVWEELSAASWVDLQSYTWEQIREREWS